MATERNRIAGELHDSVAQELCLIKSYVKTIEGLPAGSDKRLTYIQELKTIVDQSISNVRNLAHDFSVEDNRNGFIERLLVLAERQNKLDSIKINLDFSLGELRSIDKQLDNYLYCVIQEFVQNSIKHASASLITIKICHLQNRLFIHLEDNGMGFCLENIKHSFGLDNMKQRLNQPNINYLLASEIGSGTRLEIEIYG